VGRLTLHALALAALLGVASVAHGAPDRGPFQKLAVITLREEAGEAIDNSVKTSVLRRIQEARDWGADCVVLDVESYGGLVSASIETGDEIFDLGREIHTIAYVHRRAISGASMLSMACREIVMSAAATIGDSRVVYMGPDGTMVEAPEKMQTVAAGTFRKYAEVNGYPVPVAESMVRQEMEVIRFRKPIDPDDPSKGFEWVYFRADTTDTLPTLAQQELQFLTDREVVVRENELPTFTQKEAYDYGICSNKEPVPELKALLKMIQAPEGQVSYLEWTWAEQVSRFLLGIKVLLFLCGAAALYLALKTPGTGIPEVLALVFFGLFFGASAIAGFAPDAGARIHRAERHSGGRVSDGRRPRGLPAAHGARLPPRLHRRHHRGLLHRALSSDRAALPRPGPAARRRHRYRGDGRGRAQEAQPPADRRKGGG
jgi:hypothetical protein